MPELATAWVTLAVSADGMQRQIKKALNDVDPEGAGRKTGQRFSSAAASSTNLSGIEQKFVAVGQRGAQALGTALKVGVAGAVASATGVIASSLKLGFDRLTAIDEAKSKLMGLGNDAATTAKIMDSALAAVKGTAFGLGEAATIAANAVAAGVKPGEELTNYLKMTADASAIAGSSLGDMGRIINQVRTGQKAYTDDLNQLADRGIPIYQWLGEEAGVAAGDVKELASKGKISAAMFEAAISKHIGGAAQKMGGSFKGSLDNMKAALGRTGAAALEPFFNRLTGGFGSVTEKLDAVTPKIKEMAQQFDAKIFDEWIPKAKEVFDRLKGLGTNPAVKGDLDRIKGVFDSLLSTTEKVWPSLVQIGESLGKASAALGVSSWRIFLAVLESAAAVLKSAAPLIETLAGLMKNHQSLVTGAAGAWLLFRTIPSIMGRVTPALKSVNDTVVSMAGKFSAARSGVSNFGSAYRDAVKWIKQADPTLSTSAARMTILKNAGSNLASGGLGVIKGAAGGVVGALGGPFSAALVVAGAAFAAISSKNDAATASLNNYNEALKRSKEAQTTLNDALIASGGVMDEKVLGDLQNRLGSLKGELDSEGGRTGSFLDQFRDESGSLAGGFRKQIFAFGDNPEGNLDTKIRMEADTAKSASAAIDNLNLSQENLAKQVGGDQSTFDALVQNLEKQGAGGLVAAERFKQLRIDVLGAQQAGVVMNPVLKKLGDDVVGSAGRIKSAFEAIPKDVPVNVHDAGGQAVLDLLTQLGQKVSQDNDKNIKVDAPLAPEVLATLKSLGFEVTQNNDKTITVRQVGAKEAGDQIDQAAKDRKVQIEASFAGVSASGWVSTSPAANNPPTPHRLFGAIVPMADGGYRWIEKPQTAGLYSGRGAGTVFAEQETGGEAYIPLAPSKRPRSMKILMEVARLFGLNRNAEGSITVDELKSYASGISGGTYVRGGPAGLTGTDCSGGQAAIANFITGASGRFATGNEAQALSARGFQQGDPPSGIAAYWIGWKNGGPGGGHTAGTILDPEGGNVNVEMGGKSGGGAFGGAAAGASEFPNRAWIALAGYGEDPTKSGGGSSSAVKSASASVTSAKASTASAQNALDKANADLDALKAKGASADKLTAAEKKRDVAEQKLTAAQERQTAAETRLSEAKDKQANKAEKDTGAQGFGQQLASGLFGGVMESIGLPGFSNMLEWPLLKSGQSLLNAFAGPIKGALEGKLGIQQPGWSPGMPIGEEGNVVGLPGGGGELPGISLPGVGDFLKPMPDAGRQLRPNEPHQGTGGAPGPSTTVNYNMSGVDPKAGLLKADAHANQTYKKTLGAVRPS
ncbi:tape measure protein [Mycolicibacterium sp.]|uniref:tape measure protein n=1 Tax=Mycolicibacterium sp. TaxID=2320850 RepID=UPI0037C96DA6